MRVLLLARYGRLGASSRMRTYQYLPTLTASGIRVTEAPLFGDSYVLSLQNGAIVFSEVVRAYIKRLQAVLTSTRYDLLWIEKEALPWIPAWIEQLVLPGGVPYVIDYDDAVFHYYDQHRYRAVRAVLANKHLEIIRRAALVVAGNEYLADYARAAGAGQVEVIPTVVDLRRYDLESRRAENGNEIPTIGWIGQRSTAGFLGPLVPLFERLLRDGTARIVAIGINAESLGLPMRSVGWAEETEAQSLSTVDIGIMPLVDGPFERGKCGYKLIQYMASGIPVVASPVGVNSQIVEHGINGFLATTVEKWEQALRALLEDASLRKRMGAAGRAKVEREYCIQVTAPKLVQLLWATGKST